MQFKRNIFSISLFLAFGFLLQACATPYVRGKIVEPKFISKKFDKSANEIYRAVRFAFRVRGHPIAEENLEEGVVKSAWVSTTSDSHYISPFGRPDYGVNGAYHQLEAQIIPEESGATLKIGSRIQSVVANLKSSGREERRIIKKVSEFLRSPEVHVTNIGILDDDD